MPARPFRAPHSGKGRAGGLGSLLAVIVLLLPAPARADHAPVEYPPIELPAISIIIDDLGNSPQRDRDAILLPGAVAYSFLPHTPHARELAALAHSRNKEVMLHLPMQPVEDQRLGPGGVTLDMSQQEFAKALQADIASVPHVVGINNHMGSLLTRHPGHMLWLMQGINRHGSLFFVDSYTTDASIGLQVALENRVPSMRRDVFLDHDRDPAAIRAQFRRLLQLARRNGVALAIGHPYPETIAVLARELMRLDSENVHLVPVSTLIKHPLQEIESWRASSSR